jgi:hypothetical protein
MILTSALSEIYRFNPEYFLIRINPSRTIVNMGGWKLRSLVTGKFFSRLFLCGNLGLTVAAVRQQKWGCL